MSARCTARHCGRVTAAVQRRRQAASRTRALPVQAPNAKDICGGSERRGCQAGQAGRRDQEPQPRLLVPLQPRRGGLAGRCGCRCAAAAAAGARSERCAQQGAAWPGGSLASGGRAGVWLAAVASSQPESLLAHPSQGLEAFTQLEKLSLGSLGLKSLEGLPAQVGGTGGPASPTEARDALRCLGAACRCAGRLAAHACSVCAPGRVAWGCTETPCPVPPDVQLQRLAVNDNSITGASLTALTGLQQLRHLDLAGGWGLGGTSAGGEGAQAAVITSAPPPTALMFGAGREWCDACWLGLRPCLPAAPATTACWRLQQQRCWE